MNKLRPYPWIFTGHNLNYQQAKVRLVELNEELKKENLFIEHNKRHNIRSEVWNLEDYLFYRKLITSFNIFSPIWWRWDEGMIRPTREAKNLNELLTLQKSANELADYLNGYNSLDQN